MSHSDKKPLVLLSNDDGFDAEGIRALKEALATFADVVLCAPLSNQSATSHSLTLHRILRLKEASPTVWAVDGTPADCVYVALHGEGRIVPRRPDLCVSGLNHGLNLGVDVFYSGTVAAAREAAIRGIPSLAVSAADGTDRARAASVVCELAEFTLSVARGAASVPLLNVNFPRQGSWTWCSTKLGRRVYDSDVIYRNDPRGGEYLWIGGSKAIHHEGAGTDTEAYDRGDLGITPLSLDLTANAQLDGLAAAIAAR
jgi:5'-nucleotidase